jgi:hypothetical protein
MVKRGQSLRRAKSVRKPAKSAIDLRKENAALKRELAREREQRAAINDALTATSDVLKIISRSTVDLALSGAGAIGFTEGGERFRTVPRPARR